MHAGPLWGRTREGASGCFLIFVRFTRKLVATPRSVGGLFSGAVQWRSAGANLAQRTLLLKHVTGSLLYNGFNLLNGAVRADESGAGRNAALVGGLLIWVGRSTQSLRTVRYEGPLASSPFFAVRLFCETNAPRKGPPAAGFSDES